MKFIDETELEIMAGDGGNGCVSFRREKYVPKGGPSGGDGGRGGSVIFRANGGLTTLLDASLRRHIRAGRGGHGMGSQMNGRAGEDKVFSLPVGTIVKDSKTGEIVADLVTHGMEAIIAKGGRGGRGNMNFKSSVNQAPRRAEKGTKGEHRFVKLELKLLADVGLVGLPNAGKSSLISAISNARPKVADYPFTTKIPCLGLVRHKGKSFTVADIPGLIEGAHEGLGLGIRFLKHVERTRIIIHVIDCASNLKIDPLASFNIIKKELKEYSERLGRLPEVVALNKIDIPEGRENAVAFKSRLQKHAKDVVLISAVTKEGLGGLMDRVIKALG